MKVIVTGGSGRIGKAVIRTLVDRGDEVLNLDRRPADRPGAKFVYMDLRRRELLQPVMEQAEHIIHMGEIPNARSGHNTEEEVFGTNCTVGSLIFQIASELRYKRVLYTSTVQVYGYTDLGAVAPACMPIDESHPLAPQNCYAVSKVAVENYARICARKSRLSVGVFRLPWVMTEEINEQWFAWTDRNRKLDNDMGVYVKDSDVAECFALALAKPYEGFEAYNLGAREVMYGGPIREAIARDFPAYPQLPATWGKFQSPYVWEKAHQHFAWTPAWNYLDKFREKFGRDPNTSEG